MRERLAASADPGRVFAVVCEAAWAEGLVGARRVLDSTPLYDAVATMDTLTMIRSAVRGLLKAADRDLEGERWLVVTPCGGGQTADLLGRSAGNLGRRTFIYTVLQELLDPGGVDLRRAVGLLDRAVMLSPLVAAIFNPGSGLISGFGFALAAIAYFAARYGLRRRYFAIDAIGVGLAAYVLASPLWAVDPADSRSPSVYAFLMLLYLVAIRGSIMTSEDLLLWVRDVALIVGAFSVLFILTAEVTFRVPTDAIQTARESVKYANANYAGFILALGSVMALWWVIASRDDSRWLKVVMVCVFFSDCLALSMTGSRSALGGVLLGVVALALGPLWRPMRWSLLAAIPLMFWAQILPFINQLALKMATALGAGSFSRSDDSILSGREYVWAAARELASHLTLAGYGVETYVQRMPVLVHAHAWGLEFMLSIGLLGALAALTLTVLCFACWGSDATTGWGRRDTLFNTACLLAMAPTLVLGAVQWTLWSWAAFALMSKAHLLSSEATDAPRDDTDDRASAAYRPRAMPRQTASDV